MQRFYSLQHSVFLLFNKCLLEIAKNTLVNGPVSTQKKHKKTMYFVTYWWLVRVTLVVDWLFLPRNFGLVVGTYKFLLPFCECTYGGGSICRWWGHLNTTSHNQTFCTERQWGAKKLFKLHGYAASCPGCKALCPYAHCMRPCALMPRVWGLVPSCWEAVGSKKLVQTAWAWGLTPRVLGLMSSCPGHGLVLSCLGCKALCPHAERQWGAKN